MFNWLLVEIIPQITEKRLSLNQAMISYTKRQSLKATMKRPCSCFKKLLLAIWNV